MSMPGLGRLVDERFLTHRLRSTSFGGVAGGVVAICLFAYRYYVDHLWSWDLLAVSLTVVGVKLAVLTWYRWTD